MRYLGVTFIHFNVMAQYDVILLDTYHCLSIEVQCPKWGGCSASSSTSEATCPVLALPYSRKHPQVRGLGGKDSGSTSKANDRRGSWGDGAVSVAPCWPRAGAWQWSLVLLPPAGHGAGHPQAPRLRGGDFQDQRELPRVSTGHLQKQGTLPTANRLGGQGGGVGQDTLAAALILTKEEQKMARDQGPGPRAWPLAGAVTRMKMLCPEEGLPSPQPLPLPCDGAHFHGVCGRDICVKESGKITV